MKTHLVFGIHAVTATLNKNADAITALYLSDDRKDTRLSAVEATAAAAGVEFQRISGRELDRRFSDVRHQGVVAECKPREPLSEPEMLRLLTNLSQPALVLVLDGVTDPHNLGAILRSADAVGVHCVLAPRNASVGITPVVRKVASGAAESVPFCQVANLARSMAELKTLGIWLYGAAAGEETVSYSSVDYTGPVALVMGAEGKGLRRLTMQACDGLVNIPMSGYVDSLNVSVATGVCLYEVVRQRLNQCRVKH